MKAAFCIVILILVYAVMHWLGDKSLSILPSALPGLGGRGRPAIYEWGALALCLLAVWGIGRATRGGE